MKAKNRVSFELPTSPNVYPLSFQLQYQQAASHFGVLGWNVKTVAPRIFGAGSLDVFWKITLPVGEHLLSFERNLQPQFRWLWNGIGWRRVNFTSAMSANQEPVGATQTGPQYHFRLASSGNSAISIRTIRQSALLLFGAGSRLDLWAYCRPAFHADWRHVGNIHRYCSTLGNYDARSGDRISSTGRSRNVFVASRFRDQSTAKFSSSLWKAIDHGIRKNLLINRRVHTIPFGSRQKFLNPDEQIAPQTHAPVTVVPDVPVGSSSQLEDSVS